jgi:RNA polymerase sigma-70 factor (ECF subfamily)
MERGDDDLLLAQAKQGDALAFGAWIERQYDFIYRIAFRLLGNRMDAEDLTHDVCLALPDKIARYSGTGSVRGWLAQVTLNAGRDGLRRKKRRQTVDIADCAEPGHDGNAAEVLYLQEVIGVMQTLPEKSCHALLLAAEGLTQAEMALALGCAEGTVAWRVSTARDELAKRLQEGKHAAR